MAKESKLRITNFELEATRELQTSSLSSKMSVQDDIVRETLYVCNQNFDQKQFCQVCCLLRRYVEGSENSKPSVPSIAHDVVSWQIAPERTPEGYGRW